MCGKTDLDRAVATAKLQSGFSEIEASIRPAEEAIVKRTGWRFAAYLQRMEVVMEGWLLPLTEPDQESFRSSVIRNLA